MTNEQRRALRHAIDQATRLEVVVAPSLVEIPSGWPHGTEAAYRHHNCRCEACRAAATLARRRRRSSGVVATHNASGYRNGCRCDVCTAAERERSQQRWRNGTKSVAAARSFARKLVQENVA